MKRLMVLVVLVSLFCAADIPPNKKKRKGLVVNEFDGKIVVNTHPEQPMKLDPWEQPRLSIQMEWPVFNKNGAIVKLSFLSMSKVPTLCSEFAVFEGEWRDVGQVEYTNKSMKSGVWEVVHVVIDMNVLRQLAFSKMPLKVRVCEVEFYLHKFEAIDLREAFEIWEEW